MYESPIDYIPKIFRLLSLTSKDSFTPSHSFTPQHYLSPKYNKSPITYFSIPQSPITKQPSPSFSPPKKSKKQPGKKKATHRSDTLIPRYMDPICKGEGCTTCKSNINDKVAIPYFSTFRQQIYDIDRKEGVLSGNWALLRDLGKGYSSLESTRKRPTTAAATATRYTKRSFNKSYSLNERLRKAVKVGEWNYGKMSQGLMSEYVSKLAPEAGVPKSKREMGSSPPLPQSTGKMLNMVHSATQSHLAGISDMDSPTYNCIYNILIPNEQTDRLQLLRTTPDFYLPSLFCIPCALHIRILSYLDAYELLRLRAVSLSAYQLSSSLHLRPKIGNYIQALGGRHQSVLVRLLRDDVLSLEEKAARIKVLLELNDYTQTLNLEGNQFGFKSEYMGIKGAVVLAQVFKYLPRLMVLNIRGNRIGHIGVLEAMKNLRFQRDMRELNVGDNDLGVEAARALARNMKHMPKLAVLNISQPKSGNENGQIEDNGISAIASQFKYTRNLVYLDISRNYIALKGVLALVANFKYIRNLSYLNLSRNSIGEHNGGCATLCKNFRHIPNLNYLNIEHNAIGNKGAIALSQNLKDIPFIIELHLEDNNIQSAGAKALAHNFNSISYCRELMLQRNDIGNRGGGTAIAWNLKSLPLLKNINIGYNDIGYEAKHNLARHLPRRVNLKFAPFTH